MSEEIRLETTISVKAADFLSLIRDIQEMAKPRAIWHCDQIVMASEVIKTLIFDLETIPHRLAHIGGFDDVEQAEEYLKQK